jgi:hypothetical protein
MPLPNFLIIGAPRSGTTTLYEGLRQHPEIYMSPYKEPWYFALKGQAALYEGPGDQGKRGIGIRGFDAYAALFKDVTREKAIGEASTLYLYSERAMLSIRDTIPRAKLVAILRNPADRAFSNYMKHVQQGREPLASFEAALEAEAERMRLNWSPFWFYRAMGLYGEQLSRYMRHFAPEQLRVFLFDDLVADRARVFSEIFRFLGVDAQFRPKLSARQNVSGKPRSRAVHQVLQGLARADFVGRRFRRAIPVSMRRWYRQSLMARLMGANLRRQHLRVDTRARLLDSYTTDIMLAQGLLRRDLSHWLAQEPLAETGSIPGTGSG